MWLVDEQPCLLAEKARNLVLESCFEDPRGLVLYLHLVEYREGENRDDGSGQLVLILCFEPSLGSLSARMF